MTTYEFTQFILQSKKGENLSALNEEAAIEVAQLISGSFTYALCEALWVNGFDMDNVTEHLESMYDNSNHFGFVYFLFILSDAVNFDLPVQFIEMAAKDFYIPILSAAIVEDLLDFNYEFGDIPDSE